MNETKEQEHSVRTKIVRELRRISGRQLPEPPLLRISQPAARPYLDLSDMKFVIDARVDATTCPSCRVAVPVGLFCSCPMRWKG